MVQPPNTYMFQLCNTGKYMVQNHIGFSPIETVATLYHKLTHDDQLTHENPTHKLLIYGPRYNLTTYVDIWQHNLRETPQNDVALIS